MNDEVRLDRGDDAIDGAGECPNDICGLLAYQNIGKPGYRDKPLQTLPHIAKVRVRYVDNLHRYSPSRRTRRRIAGSDTW